jgi:hypothetical protein
MATTKPQDVEDAVALVRPTDALGVPLGPGQPSEFLHGLAKRDDYEKLDIYGALLVDFYEIFTKPGVCRPPARWDHLSVCFASGMGPSRRQ